MNRNGAATQVRFILVGGLNTVVGYLMFAGLTRLGWPDFVAVPVATAVGVAFNFMTYGKLVFDALDRRNLPRFLLTYLALYLCNVTGLRALGRLGMGPYVAQAALAAPLAVLSYVLNDRWVFRAK